MLLGVRLPSKAIWNAFKDAFQHMCLAALPRRIQAHQRHVDTHEGGGLVGELSAGADSLVDAGVDAFDRGRAADDFAYLDVDGEEGTNSAQASDRFIAGCFWPRTPGTPSLRALATLSQPRPAGALQSLIAAFAEERNIVDEFFSRLAITEHTRQSDYESDTVTMKTPAAWRSPGSFHTTLSKTQLVPFIHIFSPRSSSNPGQF